MLYVKAVVKFGGFSREFCNVFYYQAGIASLDYATSQGLANAIVTGIYNPIRDAVWAAARIREVETEIWDSNEWQNAHTVAMNWTGNSNSQLVSPTAAYALMARTSRKRVRGLKYVVGVTEDVCDHGWIRQDRIPLFTAAANAYATPRVVNDVQFVPLVWGRTHGFTPIVGALPLTSIRFLNRRQYQ